MSSSKSECRKFSPNIFNRSKCQHCFASKDAHSAEALDSNRVTRKVSKCGYLFVAPDWDFSNPLNRTKRWQRRWFVLYDDGEWTYSVDEHPETVPQAIIDMTKVLEVTNAEDVTGNKFAIALTLPERVHFIKGTSREESQWWFHELAVFPRSIKNSRYKRNATFPGGKACITKPIEALMHSPDSFHSQSESHLSRRRFLSCDTNQSYKENNNILMPASISKSSDLFKTENANIEIITHPIPNEETMVSKKNNENLSSQGFHPVSSINDKVRLRHLLKREKRSPLNPRSHSDTVSYMIKKTFEMDTKQPKLLQKNSNVKSPTKSSVYEHGTKRTDCENQETKGNPSVTQQFLNDKNLEISRKLTENSGNSPEEIQTTKQDLSFMKPTLDNNQNYCIGVELAGNKENKLLGENSEKQQSDYYPAFSTPTPKTLAHNDVHMQSEQVRGDPDGCGIDGISSHCSCLSEQELINSHDYVQSKKGWLMLQNLKDWNKYWFVLKKNALVYFQDPLAEEKIIAEGSFDLSKIHCIEEMESPRHYGFHIVFKDGQKVNITALTNNIRSGWIDAIRKILDQKEWNKDETLSLGEKIEKEISLIKNLTYDSLPQDDQKQTIADSFSSPRSDMSSDDEFKTASETSGRTEDYFEWADEDGDHNSSSRALPPSPPLNRTPISRVKERARTRSNTRVTSERKEKKRPTNCELSAMTRKDDPIKDDHSGSDREFFSLSDSRRRIRQKKLEKKKPSGLQETDKKKGFASDAVKNNSLTDVTVNISSLESQIAELNKRLNSKNEELSIKNERITELERIIEHHDKSDNRVNEKTVEDQNKMDEKINADYEKLSENLEQRLLFSEGKILHLLSEMDYIHRSHQSYVEALTADLEGMKIENRILKEKLEQMYSYSDEKEKTGTVINEKDELILQYKAEISALKSILSNETSDDTVNVVEQFKELRRNDVPAVIQVKNAGIMFSRNSHDESKIKNNTDSINDNRAMESTLDKDYDMMQKKLTRAMSELRFLKQELKKSHESNDDLELLNIKLRQDLKNLDDDYASQISLMKVRIEDLTSKLACAEKNNRQLKQRITRQDNKEQRRTRSLKGKESFTFGKELETKLEELEKKLDHVQKNLEPSDDNEVSRKSSEVSSIQTTNKEISGTEQLLLSSPGSISDPLKFLVRMNDLERKVQGASEKLQALKLIPSNTEEISLCLNDINLADKGIPSNTELSEEGQSENQRTENASACISSLVNKCIKIAEEQFTCCNCRHIHGRDSLVNMLREIEKQLKSSSMFPPSCDYETIQHIVLKIKNLLKKKIDLLDAMKSSLKNYSLSSPKAILELWVERILSETFLMGKISYLLQQLCEKTNLYQLKKVRSCYFKMVSFEKKLWRLHSGLNSSSNIATEMTSLDPIEPSNFSSLFLLQNIKEIFLKLEHHEQVIKKLFDSYKMCSIKNLSKLLAYKTIMRSQTLVENADCVVTSKIEQPLEPGKLSAPDVLSKKLIEAEIHHIIATFSKIFEEKIFLELEMTFFPPAEEDLKREAHVKNLKAQLSHEMDLILHELQDSYHDSLCEIQLDNKLNQGELNNVTITLAEFVCTVAQNAITLGHFNYLKGTVQDVSCLNFHSRKEFLETAYDSFDMEENLLNIDIDEYINKNSTVKEELTNVLPYLNEIFPLPDSALKRYISVQDILQTTFDGKPSYFMNSYEARLQRSFRRGQRSVTLPICTTNSGTPSPEKQVCLNCQKLQEEVNTLKALHADALEAAKAEYEETISSLEMKFKEDISSVEKNYLDNIKTMQEQICKMEKRQIGKQEEYDQEITALKETYEQEIVQKIDTKVNEEMIRQKYQAEIEQLRGLCEKGLVAMENSHRRIIAELEEKHHRELEVLQVEKEQALAEETQATLAALDAMRKAHEAELQREIAKFKQEFLQKMQATHEIDVIHKEHEGEMETIKQEILSLSEKYSIKCLENASLEERLEPLTRQLTDANTLIFDLTARNKQLRAMLEMSSTGLQAILDAECSAIDFDKMKALKIQLQLKETELHREKETVAELEQKLSMTKKNEHELHNQCRFLDQSLKAERQLREDEVSSLRDRLEHIILTSNAPVKGTNQTHLFNLGDQSLLQISMSDHKKKMENIFRNELVRSPSCPGLNVSDSFPLADITGIVLTESKPFMRIREKK